MTQQSVVLARLASWYRACEVWEFEIDPPLTASVLGGLDDGVVRFHASRIVTVHGTDIAVTLTVEEAWRAGTDPDGDHALEMHGCFAQALRWHVQVGVGSGELGAERLDVTPAPDDLHPRVHRHPYGGANSVRLASEFPPPEQWLYLVDVALGGLLGGRRDDPIS